jgi:hypothetical protein
MQRDLQRNSVPSIRISLSAYKVPHVVLYGCGVCLYTIRLEVKAITHAAETQVVADRPVACISARGMLRILLGCREGGGESRTYSTHTMLRLDGRPLLVNKAEVTWDEPIMKRVFICSS